MRAKSIVIHWWPICRMAGLFRMWKGWKGGKGDAPTPKAAGRTPAQEKIWERLQLRLKEWQNLANGLLTSPYISVPELYNNMEKYTDGNIDTQCLVNADQTEDRVRCIVWTTHPVNVSRQGNALKDSYVPFIDAAQGTGFQPIPGPVMTVSNDTIHATLQVWVMIANKFCIFITVDTHEYLSRTMHNDKDGNIAPPQLKTSLTITVQKIMRDSNGNVDESKLLRLLQNSRQHLNEALKFVNVRTIPQGACCAACGKLIP